MEGYLVGSVTYLLFKNNYIMQCLYLQYVYTCREILRKKKGKKEEKERQKERSNETLILVCNHGIGAMHAFEWTVLRKQCR